DKTGTLTSEQQTLEACLIEETPELSEDAIRLLLRRMCAASDHVLARSALEHPTLRSVPLPVGYGRSADPSRGLKPAARDMEDGEVPNVSERPDGEDTDLPEPEEVRTVPGLGIEARLGRRIVRLGSVRMMHECGARLGPALEPAVREAERTGRAVLCLAVDDRAAALLTFSESFRPQAVRTIEELKRQGCRVVLLTGDRALRGQAVARRLGVEVLAELRPEEKAEQIRSLRTRYGPVAMVGDGLNDAPALSAADVGFALGCGADLTREAGDVCLLGDELPMIPWSIGLARRTVRIIKQNLVWAVSYNTIGIGLALAGRLNPVLAALAMFGSSLAVVTNSQKAGRVLPSSGHSSSL
ncbi:MAG: cation-translocating P-type ATPase, partial [Planctomycetota bacterium]